MNLKREHEKVYGRNYQSKAEFKDYLSIKRKKLVDIKNKVENIKNHHWDYFANHKLAENVKEEIDIVINRLTQEIEHIDNYKDKVKG